MRDSTGNEHWFVFDGHRVFYRRAGTGDSIVFLPNATLTGHLWEHQVGHFRATHQVITVDLPGFGRSDRFETGTTLALYVRWLERFVADLELAPVVLVGNCIGSLSALHYAARRPEAVSALVLLNTLTSEVNRAGLGRLADIPNSRLQGPPVRWYMRHMPRRQQERFLYVRGQFGPIGDATGEAYREHTRRCFADPTTRLAYFDLGRDLANWVLPEPDPLAHLPPLCWIWGEANRLLPLETGRRQLEILRPEEVHILERCGYAAAWETPNEVNRIIEGFLARHGAARHGTAEAPAGTRH